MAILNGVVLNSGTSLSGDKVNVTSLTSSAALFEGAVDITSTISATSISAASAVLSGALEIGGIANVSASIATAAKENLDTVLFNGNVSDFAITASGYSGSTLALSGNATINGDLEIGGIANVSQSIAAAAASGAETLDQVLSNGNVSTQAITASGYSGSTLALSGDATINGSSTVAGNSTFSADLLVGGALGIAGIANVSQSIAAAAASGAETLDQVLSNGNVSTQAITASGYSGSTLALSGDATINGGTTILGSSAVTGNSTFSNDLLVFGALGIGGIMNVSQSLAQALLPSTETLQDVLANGSVSNLAITASGYSGSTLALTGNATINGDLGIGGIANVSESIAQAAASGTETLDQVLANGNVSTLAITASGFSGSTLQISGNATVGSLVETSSERFKENIVTLSSQVSNISLLNPVSFDWIESGQHDFGFIAEQVEQVYPEFVEHNEEGLTTGVKYSKMVSVLVKAVQELQVEVAELKANK